MEVARGILAIAGKFPDADYQDLRFNEPADDLKSNLGRMPVMNVGDESIGQSFAIYHYLASENGLMGSSSLEAAKIVSVFEHVRELGLAYRTLVPYGEEPAADKGKPHTGPVW